MERDRDLLSFRIRHWTVALFLLASVSLSSPDQHFSRFADQYHDYYYDGGLDIPQQLNYEQKLIPAENVLVNEGNTNGEPEGSYPIPVSWQESESENSAPEEDLEESKDKLAKDGLASRIKQKGKGKQPLSAQSIRVGPGQSGSPGSPPLTGSLSHLSSKLGQSSSEEQHGNLFGGVTHLQHQPQTQTGPNDSVKPVLIVVNVQDPQRKGDPGQFLTDDRLYSDEEKKAEKKAKKAKKKEEKKKKLAAKKKKKKGKKKGKKKSSGSSGGWGWPPMQEGLSAQDLIERLSKVHSNVQEIKGTFKGMIRQYIRLPYIRVSIVNPPPEPSMSGGGWGMEKKKEEPKGWKKKEEKPKKKKKGWRSNRSRWSQELSSKTKRYPDYYDSDSSDSSEGRSRSRPPNHQRQRWF